MRTGKSQRVWTITLTYVDESTKTVHIKASTYEVACRRALKHNKGAIEAE